LLKNKINNKKKLESDKEGLSDKKEDGRERKSEYK
jgi:hypothetical protein